ncbi:MAG: class I SAM-dependent methyltransferase [Gammaproteobacteria bacterium]|nr:class I SAM-dependent methyltransferase [Gammaproteobacteria bacterium]
MNCRFCNHTLSQTFVDLGLSPLANSYVPREQVCAMEPFYPLHAYVCDQCLLVQLMEFQSSENIFSHYAYFSSYSSSWLEHAKRYVDMAVRRFGLNEKSLVVEIASNDGYLLQYMRQAGVPVLGIEPAKNVAEVAVAKGIPTVARFFGEQTARDLAAEGKQADLLLGNNVLAHVPNLNDFIAGMKLMLRPGGVITMEFPHLARLVDERQFDTIYHEHFSYFSLSTVERIFAKHGITLFDVEELPTHGGSLRIFGCHTGDVSKPVGRNVLDLKAREQAAGFGDLALYGAFTKKVTEAKRDILNFLIEAKRAGKSVVGYGAPAKGNTLLNYCGVRTDMIDYTVDASPHKQGHYLPGTRIPIYGPDKINQTKPDYIVILPWNLKDEIMQQMAQVRDWGGKFVTFIPSVTVQ